MKRFGFWRSLPIADRKKPADIPIAPSAAPSRATNSAKPSRRVASTRIVLSRPRMTSTPACAWPARKNDFWKSVVGTPPVKTRSRNVPPYWIVTIASSRMPAVVDELSDSVIVMVLSLDSDAIYIG
jgi:hypothetical protein